MTKEMQLEQKKATESFSADVPCKVALSHLGISAVLSCVGIECFICCNALDVFITGKADSYSAYVSEKSILARNVGNTFTLTQLLLLFQTT